MSVTEYERNQLFSWFEEHMGSERAATMMNLLPPVGWGDVATKRDIDRLDARIDTVAERLETKIDIVAERLETKIDTFAERLDAKIGDIRHSTRADMQELRSDLQRTFVTWMLISQATVVTAVGLLIAAFR
jgi:hypothetical protein